VLHDSPLTAGLAFLPVTGGIMIGSGLAQAAMKRVGVRNLTATGTIVAAAGLLLLTRLPVHGHYAADLLPGLLLLSIGMGLTFVPVTMLATSGVSAADAGLASGLYNVAQQVGGSLGLAILSTFAASRASHLLHSHSAGPIAAKVSGYHVAFLIAAIMLAGAGVLLMTALRPSHTAEVERELHTSGIPTPVGV
jgi:MFS family permease